MEEETYNIIWFHEETTHKEELQRPEYMCRDKPSEANTCKRNIVSHERAPPKIVERIDLVTRSVYPEYRITKRIEVPKGIKPYFYFTPDDILSEEEVTMIEEEENRERVRRNKGKMVPTFWVTYLSSLSHKPGFLTNVTDMYRSDYSKNFDIEEYRNKTHDFTSHDRCCFMDLTKPVFYDHKVLVEDHKMPRIDAWKLTPLKKIAYRSHARDIHKRYFSDNPRRQGYLEACRSCSYGKGPLHKYYTWRPTRDATKRHVPHFPECVNANASNDTDTENGD